MNYNLFKDRQHNLAYMSKYFDNKYEVFNNYLFYNDIMTQQEFRKCKNIDCSRSKKRARCSRKYFSLEILSKLTNAKMVFGTITLNDDCLAVSYETLKKRIQSYLKRYFFYVIKNADYGSNTERLHYHFIGLTFEDLFLNGKKSKKGRAMYNLKNDWWADKNYGFAPNYEIIEYQCADKKKISNYLVKLNNHSNKISARKSRLSILKNKNYLKKYCVFYDAIL